MRAGTGLSRSPFWIRLTHWEYWPFNVVYGPIYPVFVFLCLRARSVFFFAAANPRIRNGGFLCESKKEIFQLTPQDCQPATLFFLPATPEQDVLDALAANGMRFPLIGKPDVGGRGRGIQKLHDAADVRMYARRANMPFHIQQFIGLEKELGIFYYRLPGAATGHISGIVEKEFLSVTGDGRRSVKALMEQDPRAILQIAVLQAGKPSLLTRVPAAGEVLVLVPYGNHARGAKFLDASNRITPALTRTIDALCRRIPDFYFGRLDIRFRDEKSLEEGRDFSIIEVNGAGSEPTHIYDPRHSLLFGWKEIIRHWVLLFRISRANHGRGFPYLSWKEGIAMFREDRMWSGRLDEMASPEES